MKIPSLNKTLAGLLLALHVTALSAHAVGPEGLDPAQWIAEIDAAFADVKGFSAVLVHEDGYVVSRSGGMAGPGQPMSWNHYGNIGSANKVITALMMLRLIEDKWGRGNIVKIAEVLSTPAYVYMPTVIQNATPALNKQITIRQLLQHRSGLRTEHGSGNPFIDFLQPVDPANFDQRFYHNTNFKLLTYIIVAYGAPEILVQTNQTIAQAPLFFYPSNVVIPQMLGAYYHDLVVERLLEKAPLDVFGTCWPVEDIVDQPGREIAYMYSSQGDSLFFGGIYEGGQEAGHCKGQGGWYYSTRGLARLFRDLGTNAGVISPVLYNAMYDYDGSSSSQNDRLGWRDWVSSAKLFEVFGWNAIPRQGGTHSTTNVLGVEVYSRAGIIRLPGGYHSIAQVNSDEMGSYDITTALKNAFARSIP